MRRAVAAVALLAAATLLAPACTERTPVLPDGPWRAWLDSPGGELPFGLELHQRDGQLAVWLVNGEERIAVERAEQNGDRIVLAIEHYDSTVTAELSDDRRRMEGHWEKTVGPDRQARLAFHAVAGNEPRFPGGDGPAQAAGVEGRWRVAFESDDQPAVAVFTAGRGGSVLGTFMTTTGDYRYLAGSLDAGRLRLSCFDGAHAFLFDARLQSDGSLAGEFWSRDSWHETWTARRDPEAELPDAFALTRWIGTEGLERFAFPDLDGRTRSLADPAFAGRARILVIFGSWCPNCNDASRDLVDLHRRYRDRGLSIVGLAFELTGDLDRDTAQVRGYAAHHGIEYPLLVAGTADKAEASKSFPLVDRIRSYPTTIFLHGDGRVRAVHQGYTGPATGEAHAVLRARFESLIEELLAEGGAP